MEPEAPSRRPIEWEDFVRATIDRVYSLLFRMLASREDAEDLVQEAYLRGFRSWARFRGEADPATWIYRIALNLGRDEIGKRQRSRLRLVGAEVDPEAHAAGGPDPACAAVAAGERRVLEEALAALSEEKREVVLLCEVEGFSMEEAARTLEVPVGTVKTRLHRAREALRAEVRRRGWT